MCSIEQVDLIRMALWSRSTLIRFFEISETPSGVLRFNLSRGRSCCGWWQPFTLRRPHSIAHLLTTLRHFHRSTHSRYSLDCITRGIGILINLNEQGVNRHQFILNILWIILQIKLKLFSHLIFQRLFNTIVLIHWGHTFSRFGSGGLLSLLPYQIFYYSWTGKSYVLPILLQPFLKLKMLSPLLKHFIFTRWGRIYIKKWLRLLPGTFLRKSIRNASNFLSFFRSVFNNAYLLLFDAIGLLERVLIIWSHIIPWTWRSMLCYTIQILLKARLLSKNILSFRMNVLIIVL